MNKHRHKKLPDPKPPAGAPNCPRCKRPGVPQGTSGIYGCRRCGGLFDAEPEEGGDFSSYNPAARLIREENRKERNR